jgi:hypothetical protein
MEARLYCQTAFALVALLYRRLLNRAHLLARSLVAKAVEVSGNACLTVEVCCVGSLSADLYA